jgi:hypothetical protein
MFWGDSHVLFTQRKTPVAEYRLRSPPGPLLGKIPRFPEKAIQISEPKIIEPDKSLILRTIKSYLKKLRTIEAQIED